MTWERVGAAIEARIAELGFKIVDVATWSGISDTKLRDLRRGVPGNYRPSTLSGLERALLWEPGSISALHNGHDAVPLEGDIPTVMGVGTHDDPPGLTPVGTSIDLRHDTEALSPETRLATACDALGSGLRPLEERLGKIAAEGIDPGPPLTEAVAALDKLLGRLHDFAGAIEDLRNELTVE